MDIEITKTEKINLYNSLKEIRGICFKDPGTTWDKINELMKLINHAKKQEVKLK